MKRIKLFLFIIGLLMFTGNIFAQTLIKGSIKSESGEPLPGATVIEKGTNNGTITDLSGNYSITVSDNKAVLVVSFVGYQPADVVVGEKRMITVTLKASDVGLDEVVVTALGLKREKKALGYSVGEVKGEDLTETSQGNVLNALVGKVAGVKINQMDGTTGSSVNMIIRGATSLNNDNQPLFIVDGVPIKNQLNNFYEGADLGNAISDLNPDDIESISVLKGASAAALYGSRAGNGVVLITTRTGAKSRKGIGVSLSTTNVLEIPYHYVPYQTKFGSGKAGANKLEEAENESWGAQLDVGEKWILWNSNGEAVPLISYPNRLPDFFKTGFTTTNDVSIDGNYDKGYFRLSVGDMRNTGIIPNTDLNRSTINLNSGYNITDKLSVTANFNWTESGSDNRPNVNGEDRSDIVRSLYEIGAQVNVMDLKDYWIKGQEGIEQLRYKAKQNNVWFLANENTNAFNRDRLTSKVQLDWKLTNELKFTGRFTRDAYNENRESKKAFSTYGQVNGGYNIADNYQKETNMELNLSYNKKFNNIWNLNAFIAGNRMYAYGRNINNIASQLVIPDLYTISNGTAGAVTYRSSWSEKAIYSVYGMTSIGYKDRIYLDLTARNDWSSTLPADNRSYFYPSASLSVLLSEMIVMPDWITFTKLRAGIAQVGNDTSPYSLSQYFSIASDWGTAKQMYMGGTLKNNNLVPEMATSKEIGADFRFLNNRIGLELTYYKVQNENQVLSISLPVESGATGKMINAGLIESSGWEAGLNLTPIMTKDFKWDMNLNFSTNKTQLKELAEGLTNFSFGSVEGAMFRTYEGGMIGDIYMQPMLTVTDESSEYYGYPLLTADGKYQTDTDANHMVKIGNSNPDFNLGIQPSLTYKAFTLYANIDWSQGGQFYSETNMFFNNNGWSENSLSGATYDNSRSIEEQIKENPDAFFGEWLGGRTAEYGGFAWPSGSGSGRLQDACFNAGVRQVVSGGVKTYVENLGGANTKWLDPYNANRYANRPFPNRYLYDATYVKLREIALTYRIPRKFNEKMHIYNSSLSLIATNIFEWTAAGIDIDPERAFKSTGNNGVWLQGIEYYNAMPWTGTVGMKLNLEF
ncbi:MAG: SusC/RagA family TonB-linked outer membrane protein [Bacteroidales bacterium]|nr:SusC/RagA family TonB-linked outer membrane protein [Bacteroidales bacterium]